MLLDYSKIPFDHYGRPETPTLFLQTLGGDTLGIIPGVSNLTIRVKFSEPSEMDFDVAATIEIGGELADNPIYSELTGQRVIHTKAYGNYIIINPEDNNDGIQDTIHIKAYSLEKHWEKKLFFLEEGTFNFWSPVEPEKTILGRMIELMPGWSVGYVSPTLIGKHRTFDQYDDYLLNFAYNIIPEKYRCVCVFDTYEKTISVYDVDEQYDTIPIYLDFDNLLKETTVSELTDELVTAIKPYGENELDIQAVNPIGENYIYNLDYFIINGDISGALADKWNQWQVDISSYQQAYYGLMALKNSKYAQLYAEQAALTDMDGILTGYNVLHDVTRQARDMEEPGSQEWDQRETDRLAIVQQIEDQEAAMAEKESLIDGINDDIDTYKQELASIVNRLKFKAYFTSQEQEVLSNYIIQQVLTEETFVSSEFSGSGAEVAAAGTTSGSIEIEGSSVTQINLDQQYNKTMYTFEGGTLSHSGDYDISADIIRGTLELTNNLSEFVFTAYTGRTVIDDAHRQSGIVTLYGNYSNVSSDIHEEYEGEVQFLVGSEMSFSMAQDTTLYVSASVGEFETYSVQLELYDYAKNTLKDLAYPAYEFTVDSGNFIFAQEFEAFRNELKLGRGIHLNLGHGEVITPYLIEVSIDFEKHDSLDLVFSNRFKRHDPVNTLKDMIEKSYSSSRSFDASKYTYNKTANKQSEVDRFMSGALDAARNTIFAAAEQSVVIDGAGIRVNGNITDGNSNKDIELRIVNGMIAMSDDNWNTAKLAIGYFKDSSGSYYGVNAEVIAGKLLVGNNLIIENQTDQGTMSFKVDQTGAWLYNSQLLLQSDDGGGIMIHPDYGFAVGEDLFTTNGTTVSPSFIDQNGDIIDTDDDGMPDDLNFYIDTTGDVYMKGNIQATSGDIGGWTIAENKLYSGSDDAGGSTSTYVALSSSGSNPSTSMYAIWAGGEDPRTAPFSVKRDGTVSMKNGEYKGAISVANQSGTTSFSVDANGQMTAVGGSFSGALNAATGTFSGAVSGGTINIGNGNFVVNSNGDVTLNGNITWSSSNNPATTLRIYVLYARTALATPNAAYNTYADSGDSVWHKVLDTANDYYASYSYDNGATWTAAIKIKGSDGSPGTASGVTRNAIVEAMLQAESGDGLYTYELNGSKYLGINATVLRTGRISSRTNPNANYWDLDTGEFRLSSTATVYDSTSQTSTTIGDVLSDVNANITSVDVEYAKSTSSSTAPSSGWGTNAPVWEAGYYIWQRTATTLASGSTTYSTALCITGVKGDTGDTGKGVSSIVEQYYLSTSNSTQTGGSWENTCPTYVSGRYYWTRSYITWSDGTTSTTTPVLAGGMNSAAGMARSALARFGTCTTASSTAAKVATCSYFVLENGATIDILFSNKNTANVPTLNVNQTGAKSIKVYVSGTATDLTSTSNYNWVDNSSVKFTYDSTNDWWVMIDDNSLLDQTRVFNYLTNNQANQGLYLDANGNCYVNATYIKSGTLSADRIAAGSIKASKLDASDISANLLTSGYIKLYGDMSVYTDASLATTGGFIGYASGDDGTGSNNGIRMSNSAGTHYMIVTERGVRMTFDDTNKKDIYVSENGPSMRNTTDKFITVFNANDTDPDGPVLVNKNTKVAVHHGTLVNYGSQATSLGSSGHYWSAVYSSGGVITTSDRNQKYDISYNIDKYVDMFDLLKPVSYKLTDGQSGRTHLGLIAQDIESTMGYLDIDSMDFAAFVKERVGNENIYGLRYEEFVPILIKKIQQQQKQIDKLNERINNG